MRHRIATAIASEALLDNAAANSQPFRARTRAIVVGVGLCVLGCAEKEKAAPVVDLNAAVVEAPKEEPVKPSPSPEPSAVASAPIDVASVNAAPSTAPAPSASAAPTVKKRVNPPRPPLKLPATHPDRDFRDNLFN